MKHKRQSLAPLPSVPTTHRASSSPALLQQRQPALEPLVVLVAAMVCLTSVWYSMPQKDSALPTRLTEKRYTCTLQSCLMTSRVTQAGPSAPVSRQLQDEAPHLLFLHGCQLCLMPHARPSGLGLLQHQAATPSEQKNVLPRRLLTEAREKSCLPCNLLRTGAPWRHMHYLYPHGHK